MSPVGVLESSSDCKDWFSGEGSCKSRICNTSSCGFPSVGPHKLLSEYGLYYHFCFFSVRRVFYLLIFSSQNVFCLWTKV